MKSQKSHRSESHKQTQIAHDDLESLETHKMLGQEKRSNTGRLKNISREEISSDLDDHKYSQMITDNDDQNDNISFARTQC